MRVPFAGIRRSLLRYRLDANAMTILRSMKEQPDDFDSREHLWMERSRLLRRMDRLGSPRTTVDRLPVEALPWP